MQADRRRINGPAGGTAPPVFVSLESAQLKRPVRARKADEHRKIFLRTGVIPSASGSAYYEIPPQASHKDPSFLTPASSSLKITCTVHGPRPLPRTAAFSPNVLLTTHIKFAPFATRNRRGYVRDSSERDLGLHLETALRGIIIGERWPKAGVEIVITVLEGEEDGWWADDSDSGGGWGMMGVLAGSVTAACAGLVDAGIDVVDMVSGGVAALVKTDQNKTQMVLDPCPAEHDIQAACVVAYLQSRDEVTQMWLKGDVGVKTEELVDEAVKAAELSRTVLVEAIKEAMEVKMGGQTDAANGEPKEGKAKAQDVVMTG